MSRIARGLVAAAAIALLAVSACTNLDNLSSPGCSYTVTPSSASFDSRGGTGSLAINAANGCAWKVENIPVWLTVSGNTSGTGPGTVAFAVAGNTSTTSRTASMTVAGQTISISQSPAQGAPPSGSTTSTTTTTVPATTPPTTSTVPATVPPTCTFTVDQMALSLVSLDTSGSIRVTAGSTCKWTAGSDAGWIRITSGASGTGNGTVGFHADANATLSPRTATLTVAGIRIGVTQAALVCTFAVNPTSSSAEAAGDSGSITVTTPAVCPWTATSQASWITIRSGANGIGNGTVQYQVDTNPTSSQRTGRLVVAGVTVTINQKAPKKNDNNVVLSND